KRPERPVTSTRRLRRHDGLLQLDRCAGLFELALDRVGLFLGEAFLDRVGRPVDEVLRLLETQARDRADDLDHLDLLSTGRGEDNVEGGLLLGGGWAIAARGSACSGARTRTGRRHAPLRRVISFTWLSGPGGLALLFELLEPGVEHVDEVA